MPSRREFLNRITLAGAATFLGVRPLPVAAEPPPETTRLRLLRAPSICWAPQYLADDLLRAEGFTDVTYVDFPAGPVSEFLAADKADISLNFVGPNLIRLDQGDPVVFLAGVHVGCFEVIATERVKRIRDLKGRVAAVASLNGAEHVFLASIAANVGLDPRRDIKWISPEGHLGPYFNEGSMRLF